jgi:hypothetical protein
VKRLPPWMRRWVERSGAARRRVEKPAAGGEVRRPAARGR